MIKLTPSSVHRVAACPGSLAAEKGLPYSPNEYATEGTLLHEAVRSKKTSHLKPSQIRDVETCWRIGKALLDSALDRAEQPEYVFEQYVRTYISYGSEVIGELSTKIDFLAMAKPKALVIDWKFGRADEVDASENLQIRSYAVVAAQEYGCERVTGAIVQPRAERDRQKTVVEYGPEDLVMAREEIAGIMARVDSNVRNPGPEQCKYCKAAGTDRCPESQQALVQLKTEGQAPFPAGQALGELLTKAQSAKSIAKAVEAYVKQVLAEGGEVPGWTLKANAPRAEVTDPQKAFGLLAESAGLTAEEFTSACKVTLGTLEEVYRARKGCSIRDAHEQVRALLHGVIEAKDIAPSLARSDKRALEGQGA